MIKAIIFDFNGTMIFDQEILEKSWTLSDPKMILS